MSVTGNVGGAMEMASTGLLVMGAAVPLGMLKHMAGGKSNRRRKKSKKSRR
jgi:hypothetical protein